VFFFASLPMNIGSSTCVELYTGLCTGLEQKSCLAPVLVMVVLNWGILHREQYHLITNYHGELVKEAR
jgi:hypothetical protein